MNKKIIAIALVLVIIATAFAGCSKGEKSIINGKEYLLMTDDEGNTIVDEDQNVIAIVTDDKGEVQTYEDGEPQTYPVNINNDFAGEDFIQGIEYKITAPEGWAPNRLGRLVKEGTDGQCYVEFATMVDYEEEKDKSESERVKTLDNYLKMINDQNALLISAYEQEGYKVEVEQSSIDIQLADKAIVCREITYNIVDGKGKVVHHAVNYYFETERNIYKMGYVCSGGIGYDETFDFKAFLEDNLIFSGEAK